MFLRIAVIDYKKCRPDKCGFLCAAVCPPNKTGSSAGEVIFMEDSTVRISEELCIGCGICVRKCPFGAITIINVPDEFGTPVHQYGPNMFRLYGIPYPKPSSVVGIIGRNGTGKTTAVRILAGEIIPNFGNFEKQPSKEYVIEHFKGTELQAYFEKLYKEGIQLVHKIQYVDVIRKHVKGKVSDVLPRGERRDEVIKELAIEHLLDRRVEKLSGGELQKIAIAAALIREADVYFFDEPSSYLDIRERMRVAKAVRGLSEKKGKSVLVVEHDLSLLDYLSDYIFVVYGEPAVYGRFSGIKGVREGINQFLTGFLKEENMRIREFEITFKESGRKEVKKPVEYFSYSSFNVDLDTFRLEAEGGTVYEGEVVGIVGPNGIGKTTFIRAIAGEIEGIEGLNMTVSYKPQYVEFPDVQVRELFKDVNEEVFREVKNVLGLEKLMDNIASTLSGGEKQTVAIALTLSRDADIYLLDEPSAYLDVEQRIRASKAVYKVMSMRKAAAFVVDHDIAFIDYISDRIIVFEGKPGFYGKASSPLEKYEGMNRLLKQLDITIRREPVTGRPRINKPGSQKDREQRKKGMYYSPEK